MYIYIDVGAYIYISRYLDTYLYMYINRYIYMHMHIYVYIKVLGFGVWVSVFGCRMSGLWSWISGFGFRVPGFGGWVSGFGFARARNALAQRRRAEVALEAGVRLASEPAIWVFLQTHICSDMVGVPHRSFLPPHAGPRVKERESLLNSSRRQLKACREGSK